ncbi:unnamed protein product [Brachionus calyciflorus]|uniref:Uncharacterized protein n=1 Tax=Brachionus calyciflorus TaxID=104777 RepID=A0A814MYV5_9BILA|nr:unnamed protein product [Brachionus calyciflorus]
MTSTESILENDLIDLKYLNEFLTYFFQYYDAKTSRLILNKEIIKNFKQFHEISYKKIRLLNTLDSLTLKNFLYVLIDVFFYIEMYYLNNRTDPLETKPFYDYLKLILKEDFGVNDRLIPISDLYDLLNMEIKVNNKLRSKNDVVNVKAKKNEEIIIDVGDMDEKMDRVVQPRTTTLIQDPKFTMTQNLAPVNYKHEYPKFFYSHSKLNYPYSGFHHQQHHHLHHNGYANSMNNLNAYYNGFYNMLPFVK